MSTSVGGSRIRGRMPENRIATSYFGLASGPNRCGRAPVSECGVVRPLAGVSQQRRRHRRQLGIRGQLREEVGRGGDDAVNEGAEILEGAVISHPLGSARSNANALWIRGSVHDRDDLAILRVPPVGHVSQPGTVDGGEEAHRSDPNGQHVVVLGRDLEMDVQPPGRSVGDEEVFAIVPAAKEPPPARAQIAFDQACTVPFARHDVNAEAGVLADPLS